MDMHTLRKQEYRKFLHGLRRKEACAGETASGGMEVPVVREGERGKLLLGMRTEEAGAVPVALF